MMERNYRRLYNFHQSKSIRIIVLSILSGLVKLIALQHENRKVRELSDFLLKNARKFA